MSRFARQWQVLFWEEPEYGSATAELASSVCEDTGVTILTPKLPWGLAAEDERKTLEALLDRTLDTAAQPVVRWYYTPMMLPFSEHIAADCVVYDCMDELANFKHAPAELLTLEERLIQNADLVFTGGYSLYEAKRDRHPSVHPFPSSVDAEHFAAARRPGSEPADQAAITGKRLGFYGVIDERMDLALLGAVADARPDWALIMIGPVVKISEADLPRRPNLHYLGSKPYAELPHYLRGWDVALMPFAINEATRFISPTKTPEYLAAGCPVVSTPIADVIRHYGDVEAVRIATTPDAFIAECETALALAETNGWLEEVDALLRTISWDQTFIAMKALVDAAITRNRQARRTPSPVAWSAEPSRAYDVMVVGAGFAGAVMAERLAADGGKRVLVVDRRPHVAGNAFDRHDDAGILIHQYGPHIFHTNSADVFQYLSRFTQWRPYEHRVLASVDGMLVPMPINRTTLNLLYGLDLRTDEDAAAFLASRAEPVDIVRTSADVVISAVGRELYETFFQGYTRKQWGMDPSELDKSVTARVPTRTGTDDRYFTDKFQAMPADGYTRMFENMLDHPNIDLLLGVDFEDVRQTYPHDHLVFTGPIDEYFGYRYGKLPYRSLRFQHETVATEQHQPVAVVNYPDESVPYTRVTEYKHLTGQSSPQSSITYEYPSAEGDPYYPIPRPENQALFKRYEALAMALPDVSFVGRLATYRYYNMDQVVGQALATYRRLAERWPANAARMVDAAGMSQIQAA
ncbi:UDP-galactopyranose mutase [Novosphingobium sp. 9U]|uniref:UDP-galactopyranose mutase n=1 Tax=Novosphingobium sp. 9U TaxID=2653158 RepID=UPI00135A48FD|nr:UDP-galactopyranose mutase [Novosphingobium sp. 9U]